MLKGSVAELKAAAVPSKHAARKAVVPAHAPAAKTASAPAACLSAARMVPAARNERLALQKRGGRCIPPLF
jgi:hypothetical protein